MIDEINICGFCKKAKSTVHYPTYDLWENNYTINQCNYCSAYFLAPRPNKAMLDKAYGADYYGDSDDKFSTSGVEKVLDFFRKKRARRISRYLNENNKVLDVGCGNGKFLLFLLKYGKYELHGKEMDGNSAKRTARIPEIDLKIGMLENEDYPNDTFDAITLFHVFEHLTNPQETLDIIKKILKPGGVVIFSFPNIDSFQAKWFKGKWLHLDSPRHLFFFKPKDFKKLMKEHGFALLEEHYVSSEQNPYGMVQSILNIWCKKRDILFESMKGNDEYIKEYRGFKLFLQRIFFVFTFPLFVITDLITGLLKKGATVEFIFKKND